MIQFLSSSLLLHCPESLFLFHLQSLFYLCFILFSFRSSQCGVMSWKKIFASVSKVNSYWTALTSLFRSHQNPCTYLLMKWLKFSFIFNYSKIDTSCPPVHSWVLILILMSLTVFIIFIIHYCSVFKNLLKIYGLLYFHFINAIFMCLTLFLLLYATSISKSSTLYFVSTTLKKNICSLVAFLLTQPLSKNFRYIQKRNLNSLYHTNTVTFSTGLE